MTKPQCLQCVGHGRACYYYVIGEGDPTRGPALPADVNLDHTELLNKFSLGLISPGIDAKSFEQQTTIALTTAAYAPYLMHEILAIVACHLAHTCPERKQYYLHAATQLQNEGLSFFNKIPKMTNRSRQPIVMFSFILGRHRCIDALATRCDGLEGLLTQWLGYAVTKQRRVSVVNAARPGLLKSEISPFMAWWDSGLKWPKGEGREFGGVLDLISSSALDDSAKEACRKAVNYVQAGYDSRPEGTGGESGPQRLMQMVFEWAALVPEGFVEMLKRRRPEAIAVLGCYAVLLHLAKDFWQIGDAGEHMLRVVDEHLGEGWSDWLAWPRGVVFANPWDGADEAQER
ncbi:C6 finger domain-containing protein [Colletotrichum sojae]|uniref:C6 finger domain-containing protein n=1 Tax=Colletotrichum sojae TaxID=2175907 RepID=A0A8H6JMZ4_9PEZI|nr:C6 finger domain-containing protein [Colletotrichum sojae]